MSDLPRRLDHQALDSLLPAMSQWAAAAYPDEACGLVVEQEGVFIVRPCENLQNRLHRAHPGTYTRSARTAYSLNPLEYVKVEEEGGRVAAVFHSHPDRGAYFSDEDVLSALGGEAGGDPVLPGVDYVVLGVHGGVTQERALFRWSPAARSFVREES